MSAPSLTPDEARRYGRHLSLPDVGEAGQRRLKGASVLVVGAGGLGSPAALYLAAAGVGRLGLVDFDRVDETNLQRQLLHGTADVGRTKLDSARDRLHDLNPHVRLDFHPVRLTRDNALDVLAGYDVVADGTDNFATRYLVNDACVLLGVPNVHASVYRFEGQASVFGAPGGPCYRCLYPTPPPPDLVPSCAEGGVLGVLPGLLGCIQATEAIKWICGIGEPLRGRLLLVDALTMQFRTMALPRDPTCPVCGDAPTITTLADYDARCGLPDAEPVPETTPHALHARLAADDTLLLLDVRRPDEYAADHLGGRLLPLDELAERLDELAPYRSRPVVVYCKSGARSARAVRLLRTAGFDAVNLRGGLDAYRGALKRQR